MKKFITRAAVVILIGGMSVAIGGCYGLSKEICQ